MNKLIKTKIMEYQLLINNLNKYGNISAKEEIDIRKAFIFKRVKKKQILKHKNSVCNKLFFVNKGHFVI